MPVACFVGVLQTPYGGTIPHVYISQWGNSISSLAVNHPCLLGLLTVEA